MVTEHKRLLIAVLTYPHPSKKYGETVCTAAISEQGEWTRLYPLDLRALKGEQFFRKWNWIEAELLQKPPDRDNRPESRTPILDSIKNVGRVTAERNWSERTQIVDRMPHKTIREWTEMENKNLASLGIVRPSEVLDIEITREREEDWDSKQEAWMSQLRLFDESPKLRRLEKISWAFHYVFRCEDGTKEYRLKIRDWELMELFRKVKNEEGEEAAKQKVRSKFLDVICGKDRDTRFFIGTDHRWRHWLCIGTFWPPVRQQGELQFDE